MTDKKSWEDIPSLNVELDDTHHDEEQNEERRHARTDQNALTRLLYGNPSPPIQVYSANKGEFEGTLLDVSRSGVRLASPKNLEMGERLKVNFTLSNRQITAMAVVCWISQDENGFNVGLEFRNLPDNIAEFFESLNTANLLNKVGKVKEGSSKDRT